MFYLKRTRVTTIIFVLWSTHVKGNNCSIDNLLRSNVVVALLQLVCFRKVWNVAQFLYCIALYPFKCKSTYLHTESQRAQETRSGWSQPTHINKFRVGKLKYRVGNIKKMFGASSRIFLQLDLAHPGSNPCRRLWLSCLAIFFLIPNATKNSPFSSFLSSLAYLLSTGLTPWNFRSGLFVIHYSFHIPHHRSVHLLNSF